MIFSKIGVWSICTILLVVNLLYLILYKWNLHCDQYTSFSIAFLDFEPHPEEIPTPFVYHSIAGIVIRIISALVLAGLMILPSWFLVKTTALSFLGILKPLAAIGLTIGFAFVPNPIIGERISNYIGFIAGINLAILLVATSLFILISGVWEYLRK